MDGKIQPIKSKRANLLYGLGVIKSVGFSGNGPQSCRSSSGSVWLCVCVVFAMACLPVIQTNEEAGRQRRSLGCRRAVSWVGLRLNIIKETNETASELSQVRLRTSELFVFHRLSFHWCSFNDAILLHPLFLVFWLENWRRLLLLIAWTNSHFSCCYRRSNLKGRFAGLALLQLFTHRAEFYPREKSGLVKFHRNILFPPVVDFPSLELLSSSWWIDILLPLSGAITCDPVHCSAEITAAAAAQNISYYGCSAQCRELIMDCVCSKKNGRNFCRLPVSLSINQTCRGRRERDWVFNAVSCKDPSVAVIDCQWRSYISPYWNNLVS